MVSMKDEELAQDAVLSKVYEHEKDPETRLRVAGQDGSSSAKRAAGGVSNKPYRYIEGYHLKGPKGAFESLDVLQKKSKLNLTLVGTLIPAPGAAKSSKQQQPLEVEVPVQTWSIYAHPEERYQGLWLHAKHGEYRLGKPSEDYAPMVAEFLQCVRYAIAIHLFVTDVVGVDDAEEDQGIGLDMLLELMVEQALEKEFIYTYGNVIYGLLRDLTMKKNFPFMVQLRAVRPPKPTAAALAVAKASKAKAAAAAAALRAAAGGGGGGGGEEETEGEEEEEDRKMPATATAAAPAVVVEKKKRKRRKLANTGGEEGGASASSSSGAAAATASASSSSGTTTHTETDQPLLVLGPDCPGLKLSDEVPKLMNNLGGQNRRLTLAMEDGRTAAVVEKQLGEFDRLLDGLEKEGFEPMHYLVAGTFGGENFFNPLFELYKILKRVRLSCPESVRPRVAALRGRLVEDFTTPVLRDVWYHHNRASMRGEVRVLKEQEKEAWVAAKFQRLCLEKEEKEALRVEEKEVARQAQVVRRKERAERKVEWEKAHKARKEQRRLEKMARKAAVRERKVAAKGEEEEEEEELEVEEDEEEEGKGEREGEGEGEGEKRRESVASEEVEAEMEIDDDSDVEAPGEVLVVGRGGGAGEKRSAREVGGGEEGGQASKRPTLAAGASASASSSLQVDVSHKGTGSPDFSAATDSSTLSSHQKGALSPERKRAVDMGGEESKCTLSPMLYGSSRATAAAAATSTTTGARTAL